MDTLMSTHTKREVLAKLHRHYARAGTRTWNCPLLVAFQILADGIFCFAMPGTGC